MEGCMYVTSAGRGRELALCPGYRLGYDPGKQNSRIPAHAVVR
jgi:hypothetical protein